MFFCVRKLIVNKKEKEKFSLWDGPGFGEVVGEVMAQLACEP
jgi:hypothetical protein